jgi:hypothetical protein
MRNSGLGIVNVLIAVALLAAVSVGVMQLTKMVQKSKTTAETSTEVNSAVNRIHQVLLDKEACVHTLKDITLTGDGLDVPAIKNQKDNPIYEVGSQKYGNHSFSFQSIKLFGTATDIPSSFTDDYGQLILRVVFLRERKMVEGQRELTKDFPIKVTKDASNKIKSCYSALENMVDTAMKEACEALGGTYSTSTTPPCSNTAADQKISNLEGDISRLEGIINNLRQQIASISTGNTNVTNNNTTNTTNTTDTTDTATALEYCPAGRKEAWPCGTFVWDGNTRVGGSIRVTTQNGGVLTQDCTATGWNNQVWRCLSNQCPGGYKEWRSDCWVKWFVSNRGTPLNIQETSPNTTVTGRCNDDGSITWSKTCPSATPTCGSGVLRIANCTCSYTQEVSPPDSNTAICKKNGVTQGRITADCVASNGSASYTNIRYFPSNAELRSRCQ